MRTSTSSLGLLLVLASLGTTRAAEGPPNMPQPSAILQPSAIPLADEGQALASKIESLDPSLNHIVAANAKVMVAKGQNVFGVAEGATWVPDGNAGYLLFTDFPTNTIYKWAPDTKQLSVFLDKAGYSGAMADYKGNPTTTQYASRLYVYDFGANGVARDPQGRVVFCAHGDRAIVRLEKDGTRTVVATGYQGTQFWHPNEMTMKSDGTIYITDAHAPAPQKTGVFMIKDGNVSLATPGEAHGVTFSPDEKVFYATNYGSTAIMRYDVQPDDTLANGRVFVDMASEGGRGAPNGMAVDSEGNVYAGGPGGLWIMNPSGKHIGTIPLPAIAANAAFGDADLKTLYIIDSRNLLTVRMKVPGMVEPARMTGTAQKTARN